MDQKPQYVAIHPRSREELVTVFGGEDENDICDAMYSAAQHEPDWQWTQEQLLKFLRHKSLLIRSSAVIALGEMATFRGKLDLDLVLPELKLVSDPALKPYVEDCLEDIKTFIKTQ